MTWLTANIIFYGMGKWSVDARIREVLGTSCAGRRFVFVAEALTDGSIFNSDAEFMAGNMMNCKDEATAFMWVLFMADH